MVDEGTLLAWHGSGWVDAITAITSLNNLVLLGVGTTADSTNPFSAKLNNALWTAKSVAEGGDGDLRYKLNKETASDTLSMLLQTAYSGRAELGLTGDDDFHLKVSADGSTWTEALGVDRSSGGVRFLAHSCDVASAATCDIGAAPSLKVRITGTAAITSFGSVAHAFKLVRFAGALTLTHNATSLILPGAADILTAADDSCLAVSDGSGNWRVLAFQRASQALIGTGDSPSFAGLTVSGTAGPTLAAINGAALNSRVLSINGDGRLNRRQAGAIGNDVYCFDRWYALSYLGGTVTPSTIADVASGYPSMMRLSSPGSGRRIGLAQIIPSDDCRHLRGKSVTLSGTMRRSSGTTLRYAILEWTGSADAATSDVVNDWTTTTFTSGNFFAAANLTVTAVGNTLTTAGALTDLTPLMATLGTSFNNLIIFFFTQSALGTSDTLDVRGQLEVGSKATPFEVMPIGLVVQRCDRFYQKSFLETAAPAQNAGAGTGEQIGVAGKAGASAQSFGTIRFNGVMRAAPAVTLYNPAAANAQARDFTAAADCSVTAAGNISQRGFEVTATGNASTAVGNRLGIHWQADAEL